MRKKIVCFVITLAFMASGCTGYMKSNTPTQLFYGIVFSTSPVMNSLSITASDSTSIMLAQPTFTTTGNPAPSVEAYIGVNGVITITGSTVTGSTQGPIDVSTSGYTFTGLSANTLYRIIVVATNVNGYSVTQILQSTGGITPVLAPLVISGTTTTTISLQQPTFTTTGNPLPSVQAYIGLDGTITVSPLGVVTFSTEGPIDVSGGGCTFGSIIPLTPSTAYRIIVVASNSSGLWIQQIAQSTGGIAPVMAPLVISGLPTQTTISLQQPTFTTTGNPLPSVQAYIGLDGTIAVSLLGVVTFSIEGPIDVSGGGCTFGSLIPLTAGTAYRIIVVASNSSGLWVSQIPVSTAP